MDPSSFSLSWFKERFTRKMQPRHTLTDIKLLRASPIVPRLSSPIFIFLKKIEKTLSHFLTIGKLGGCVRKYMHSFRRFPSDFRWFFLVAPSSHALAAATVALRLAACPVRRPAVDALLLAGLPSSSW